MSWLMAVYDFAIFRKPWLTLLLLFLMVLCAVRFIPQFELDASADSLTLESDQDLVYYRSIRNTFPSSDDFLLIVFTPDGELFTESTLKRLTALKQQLLEIPTVAQINSILDVPLLNHPDLNLNNVSQHMQTLEDGVEDLEQAKSALMRNPFYRQLILGRSGKTTALQLMLKTDPSYQQAVAQRNQLREAKRSGELLSQQFDQLQALELRVKALNQKAIAEHKETIVQIRGVMGQYQDAGQLFLGGLPMIVVDMLDYVRSDLRVFGVGVLLFLVFMLSVLFRRPLWVVMPLFCCVVTCLIMVGYLGYLRFPVTVISSNFISLLLIISISMAIHLIVRYRELLDLDPGVPQKVLIQRTVRQMAKPCLFTSLTTIVAFASLIVSDIRPVIDFGIMMTIGILFAYAITFLLFPVLLMFFPKEKRVSHGVKIQSKYKQSTVSLWLARFTEYSGKVLVWMACVLALVSVWGIGKLSVENRFIDYFKESTEIYQGMLTIDAKLGGTTPLDIIIDVDLKDVSDATDNLEEDCFIDDECLEDIYGQSTVFTAEQIGQFQEIQDYLESLPETGKVMSLVTTIQVAELIKGSPLDSLELAFLKTLFPDQLRGFLLDPFVNEETGQVRFSIRVLESDPGLKRQALLDKVQSYLINEKGLNPNNVHFTSMVVLYNNMLQSLFKSQIATVGVVFSCILVMFILLFRSLYLAIIGLIPNMLAAGFVMGMMGWLGIPLDMMTITIAAISVGIAVDNTIHYIYRFKVEFDRCHIYREAMYRSHATIGKAMYYTSITIIFGFSILVFSNFYPTLYFGLFTGLGMLVALLLSLTLLPQLILLLKPLGPEPSFNGVPVNDEVAWTSR